MNAAFLIRLSTVCNLFLSKSLKMRFNRENSRLIFSSFVKSFFVAINITPFSGQPTPP